VKNKRERKGNTNNKNRKEKSILCDHGISWPQPGDKGYEKFIEDCKREAEDADEIWAGHSEVVTNALNDTYEDNSEEE